MFLKIIYLIKYFKPPFKWRVPYLILVCTVPTITLTHFSCIEFGIKTGVTIGFFFLNSNYLLCLSQSIYGTMVRRGGR